MSRPTRQAGVAIALADAQFVLAREHAFESSAKLKPHVQSVQRPRDFESENVRRCGSGEAAGALELIREHVGIAPAGLYEAVHRAHADVVRLLLDHGADPTIPCLFFCSSRPHTRLQGDWSSDVCSS